MSDRSARQPGQRRPRSHRRKTRKGRLIAVLGVVSVLALVAAWAGYTRFSGPEDFEGEGSGDVLVTVEEGSLLSAIGKALHTAGVVASTEAFVAATMNEPRAASIGPGVYKMRKGMSAKAALTLMLDPATRVVDGFTVKEGWQTFRIYAELNKAFKIPVKDFEEAAKDTKALGIDASWYKRDDGEEPAKGLEGFLFPATYEIDASMNATEILKTMVAKFMAVAETDKLRALADEHHVTPYEALIIASIIQGEGIEKDFGKISRVVWNRLDPDQWDPPLLNMDSTTNYWRELNGEERKDALTDAENHDPDNPYQTYGNRGLPPGPIGNPGKAALDAAFAPVDGKWLYFVKIDKEGNSAFAVTEAEHQENVQKAIANGAY
ncbi:hypothetical protein Afil01_27250 [Actinorhabdospora filicis]|uniref:Endolytic murein transglycosylase n=1 Tax=Actinorhabdospora filicis TaxID=1785913 RepID=A0A9W6W9E7_9ACTN|nr:endolytic transglycosylase MltG [Actinorhabdospora filicis]GLZ77918.1 hypothetical protein Afil01_27250 [Actinorhabdospora filicis]